MPLTHLDCNLTSREINLVQGVIDGLTNQAIADRHRIRLNTVKVYFSRLFERAGLHSRAQLYIWAQERARVRVRGGLRDEFVWPENAGVKADGDRITRLETQVALLQTVIRNLCEHVEYAVDGVDEALDFIDGVNGE